MRQEPYKNRLWSEREDLNSGFAAKGQAELTQEKLAKLVGTSRQTIISIEQERSMPSYPLAVRICYTLKKYGSKISLTDLFPVSGLKPNGGDGGK